MSFDKCCVLNIGSVALSPSLSLHSTVLPIVPSVCDLGVTVNSNLSPSAHVVNIVAKAQKCALLAVHRSFVSGDVHLLVRAYKPYVRPVVEHNSVIWSPTSIRDIEQIERIQRLFIKSYKATKVFHTLSA